MTGALCVPRRLRFSFCSIQLFRERLSEKAHATVPKGIVGGFEFSVLQRNLKELARKAMEMYFGVLEESNKSRFDSYGCQEQCIDHIPYYLSGLSRAHFSDNLSRNSCIRLRLATSEPASVVPFCRDVFIETLVCPL